MIRRTTTDGLAPSPLTVDPRGDRLLRDGQPLFLLADTLWAAFSRMSDTEWADALRLRRRQGFNAVNVSVLPIAHDRSLDGDGASPFAVRANGSWDLDTLDPDYFARARAMVTLAQELGLTAVLVILWCNYVPGTWGSQRTPELAMDDAQTGRYLDLVLETFADLAPIWCVSGDDSLDDLVALSRYRSALHQLRRGAPQCLTTMHSTPSAFLPQNWVDDPALDLYVFQAGHDDGWEERPTTLASRYAGLEPARPILSLEPCYEGHGFGSGRSRHDAREVRRASWAGVLAGAGAGLGYAAHGAWSWHRAGAEFTSEPFSGIPLPASQALQLPGAWDVGLLRRIVEDHQLYHLRSRQDLVLDDRSGARFSLTQDGRCAVAFLPEAFRLRLDLDRLHLDLSGWSIETWDLTRGRQDHVGWRRDGRHTVFEQPDLIGDLVYVMWQPT